MRTTGTRSVALATTVLAVAGLLVFLGNLPGASSAPEPKPSAGSKVDPDSYSIVTFRGRTTYNQATVTATLDGATAFTQPSAYPQTMIKGSRYATHTNTVFYDLQRPGSITVTISVANATDARTIDCIFYQADGKTAIGVLKVVNPVGSTKFPLAEVTCILRTPQLVRADL